MLTAWDMCRWVSDFFTKIAFPWVLSMTTLLSHLLLLSFLIVMSALGHCPCHFNPISTSVEYEVRLASLVNCLTWWEVNLASVNVWHGEVNSTSFSHQLHLCFSEKHQVNVGIFIEIRGSTCFLEFYISLYGNGIVNHINFSMLLLDCSCFLLFVIWFHYIKLSIKYLS